MKPRHLMPSFKCFEVDKMQKWTDITVVNLKEERMKILAFLTLVFMLSLFCSFDTVAAKDYEVDKKAGDLTVVIKIDKNPPVAGKNNIEIAITDTSGKVVTDAKIVVAYSMPPMPGMAPMNYKTDTELKGNVYKAQVNYSMAGSWNNEVRITRSGKTVSTRFTVDAK
jgi:hypothetical protein